MKEGHASRTCLSNAPQSFTLPKHCSPPRWLERGPYRNLERYISNAEMRFSDHELKLKICRRVTTVLVEASHARWFRSSIGLFTSYFTQVFSLGTLTRLLYTLPSVFKLTLRTARCLKACIIRVIKFSHSTNRYRVKQLWLPLPEWYDPWNHSSSKMVDLVCDDTSTLKDVRKLSKKQKQKKIELKWGGISDITSRIPTAALDIKNTKE